MPANNLKMHFIKEIIYSVKMSNSIFDPEGIRWSRVISHISNQKIVKNTENNYFHRTGGTQDHKPRGKKKNEIIPTIIQVSFRVVFPLLGQLQNPATILVDKAKTVVKEGQGVQNQEDRIPKRKEL